MTNPIIAVQRCLDELRAEERLQAWQEEPEQMALLKNMIHFQDKAAMFRARGDPDKAAYYEELVEERLELLKEG